MSNSFLDELKTDDVFSLNPDKAVDPSDVVKVDEDAGFEKPESSIDELKAAITALTKRVAVLEIEDERCPKCGGRNDGVFHGIRPGERMCSECSSSWVIGEGSR